MTDVIHLSGIEVFAHHGVFPEEKKNGQLFVLDIDVEYDASVAASTDNLQDTLDYGAVAVAVRDAVLGEPVELLEALALRVITAIFAFERAEAATVTVHKPDVAMPVELAGVSLTLYRRRNEVV
jgi:7,8-dihydroneopterin aldolase/epimerase/oxygenase